MNKQNILYGIIGVLAGFIIGFFFANSINRNAALQSANVQALPNAQGNPQSQSAVSVKDSPNGATIPEVAQTLDAAQKNPDDFGAQLRAGQMYLKIQNTDKTIEFINRAVAAHKDTFEDLASLGNAFFDVKNFEEAEKWYSQALVKNPDDVDVRTDLGSTFMERQQPDMGRAIKEYRTSLEKNPKHESTLFNLSLALMRSGDWQGAQDTLKQLETVNPNSPLISKLKEKLSQPTVK